ncbi:protein adenylyltransferase SelO [Flavobacterium channae]|uniref:protein adenylyltransferase SelO n=1 Tax=Flavobacterium channae TaxID=2897181 RepID=UPI001E2DC648|nr:YdiU family protein [Flavobacterium channae]UGS24681.1 YdiU family protein [Flavobacterium channae]
MKINLKDTFNKELPADSDLSNTRRQVYNACFSFVTPRVPSKPTLLHYADDLAETLGFSKEEMSSEVFLNLVSGSAVYPKTQPYAMAYAGHQFGNWAGQLGDGRAINLFEMLSQNQRWTLQLKGAGETPYSRNADGLAVLRSSIREHLCSEAMFHLGVPTTRSLSLVSTGDKVLRDILYNGNPAYEPGAVVCRVAPTFIRFGNFQLFAARKDITNLKALADYTINYFYPEIQSEGKEKYLQFYQEIVNRTVAMVLHWQRVGFVHGVMNTDNMSILGLTIDYGPYGWLEDYDPDWTPNTTDAEGRRYRFRNQPDIALWNLVQLGNALYPLIEDIASMEQVLNSYSQQFDSQFPIIQQQKLGLAAEYESTFQDELTTLLTTSETDMTIFYRNLANVVKTDTPDEALTKVAFAFYQPDKIVTTLKTSWLNWFELYLIKLKEEQLADAERKAAMNLVNPKYVLRNYMAQLAIEAAEKGDNSLINELYTVLKKPYDEQSEYEKWFAKRPDWARHKVGCSMLSCSS